MSSLLLPIIYLAFISLGLPDGLLGAAWPSAHTDLGVDLSYAGIISFIISVGTIVSSLQSDRLTKKFGPGRVTFASVLLTCFALFGFGVSRNFLALCALAVPYGLGAGGVDSALNNYVALHYESKHMSWLHCSWGVGAATGPYVMGAAISLQNSWNMGYIYVGILQAVLTLILFFSLPLWKNSTEAKASDKTEVNSAKPLSLLQIVKIPGAIDVMICFFGYCALESTCGLWSASYLSFFKGMSATDAAYFASMFYVGITVGRAASGFVTLKLSDKQMIRAGMLIIVAGIAIIALPITSPYVSVAGFIVIGLGCAPVYPCIIHSTPAHFGADKSQAVIGVEMASAYVGTTIASPLFGFIATATTTAVLPVYELIILALMFVFHTLLETKHSVRHAI